MKNFIISAVIGLAFVSCGADKSQPQSLVQDENHFDLLPENQNGQSEVKQLCAWLLENGTVKEMGPVDRLLGYGRTSGYYSKEVTVYLQGECGVRPHLALLVKFTGATSGYSSGSGQYIIYMRHLKPGTAALVYQADYGRDSDYYVDKTSISGRNLITGLSVSSNGTNELKISFNGQGTLKSEKYYYDKKSGPKPPEVKEKSYDYSAEFNLTLLNSKMSMTQKNKDGSDNRYEDDVKPFEFGPK